jgi:3-oxoacyl-[acyl-carrier protein] reductase
MGVLDGRVAIVSGASAGIGRGCALRYAEEGAFVIACARRLHRLEELVAEITARGGRAVPVQCDVGKPEDIQRVVEVAAKEGGRIDILANIAQGAMEDHVFLHDMTPEGAIAAYDTGPVQSFRFMKACLPYMREQHFGRIINFGSHAAYGGTPGFSAYAIAKAAMIPLTKLAAREWAPFGITTNVILPIMLNEASEMTPQGREAFVRLAATNPTGRIGSPYEDCAPVLVFLATEGAGYLNGQVIHLDGGK